MINNIYLCRTALVTCRMHTQIHTSRKAKSLCLKHLQEIVSQNTRNTNRSTKREFKFVRINFSFAYLIPNIYIYMFACCSNFNVRMTRCIYLIGIHAGNVLYVINDNEYENNK